MRFITSFLTIIIALGLSSPAFAEMKHFKIQKTPIKRIEKIKPVIQKPPKETEKKTIEVKKIDDPESKVNEDFSLYQCMGDLKKGAVNGGPSYRYPYRECMRRYQKQIQVTPPNSEKTNKRSKKKNNGTSIFHKIFPNQEKPVLNE